MPIDLSMESDGLHVLRVRGLMSLEDLAGVQKGGGWAGGGAQKARVLAIFEDFGGWEQSDWDDPETTRFAMEHDEAVSKIALVGDPRWEADALAFCGHPFTSREIRFFGPDEEAAAREWLAG